MRSRVPRGRRTLGRGKGRRRSYAPSRRRYTVRKRTYRKKPAMSNKRILNITSRKKRNGMLSVTNTTATGALAAIYQGPLTVAGGSGGGTYGYVHFRPTAMDLNDINTVPNPIDYPSVRTASTCYMRGLAENLRIETSSGNPWLHRRICFTSRDQRFNNENTNDQSGTDRQTISTGALETSNGWQRLAGNMIIDTLSNTINTFNEILFKGAQGIDWDDFITAPVDTSRVDLKFDKTWVYKSGNQAGIMKECKLWHPMNKNIVYDDDERGAAESSVTYSVTDKRGMGDYHIIDLFSQGSSGVSGDLIKVRYTSTLYWHEK
nr:MAG: capsid protein [Rhinopithecus-associated genomovirus 1]